MVYPETFQGIGVNSPESWLEPKKFEFKPHGFRDYDIDIKVEACGVCGSDIHAASGNWGKTNYPLVVGHEIIGKIVRLGSKVRKDFKVGDRVGIGAQADSCGVCKVCNTFDENYCKHNIGTYMGIYEDGTSSYGGYSSYVRVHDRFAFKIPEKLESKYAAPLLCGGITGFSPLLHNGVTKGTKVGVSGIGGIGHMSLLFAKALGAEVYAISRSDSKKEDSLKMGADHYISTSSDDWVEKYSGELDLIVNCGSSLTGTNLDQMLELLRPRGKLVFITAPPMEEKVTVAPFTMLKTGTFIGGSGIGGSKDIQFMLNFAAEHDIKPWVEAVDISEEGVTEVFKRAYSGDVRYRFTLVGYDKAFN
ncbi:NAD(P)-dependent alcohol dehydrogenase [Ascoidea rubescens DSM 1968]|uniref:GroES-like protein n=1 Tax=Ascoidea rubescens DSM 1968 TaxID=1344418 RepID=A0A1D2VCH2_9ASCO|nr:GroES-like protein [Ascoidea rubescens DSM 1968]ODV59336.1 GroES-like protein [Ascoidea rubescens DSM 1968]